MPLRVNIARISGPAACPLLPDDHSEVLLLCLTGKALDRPFMQRWSHSLDSRYGSFWKDRTVYDCRASLLLIVAYVFLCLPCSFALTYMARGPLWCGAIISILLQLALWRILLAHHYFSKIENQFAFNVNTQIASFFKQYSACSMKPYGELVPYVTISRMFVDSLKITFTVLCYHAPSDTSLIIPTACEAIDRLRANKHTNFFINLIVVCSEKNESTQALHDFFTASGFCSAVAIDKSILICSWGRKNGCTIRMQTLPEIEDLDYNLLPITFTVDHTTTDIEPVLIEHAPPHFMSPLVCRPHYSRSMRSSMVMQRPLKRNRFLDWLQRQFPGRQHCYYHQFDNYQNQLVFMS